MATKWTPAQSHAMEAQGRNLLLSAAAGSGKTATLTARIIRSLTDPEHSVRLPEAYGRHSPLQFR